MQGFERRIGEGGLIAKDIRPNLLVLPNPAH